MTTNGRTPPVEAWQVATMRVTALLSEAVAVDRLNWWEEAVGIPPEEIVSRPKTGQYQAHGDFEGRRLTLQVQPGRVDWTFNAVVKSPEEEFSLALLGPLPEVTGSLLKVVNPWLPKAPPLARLAFGTTLLQPVDIVRAGYVRLQEYLRYLPIVPEKSSDFFYQINRPQLSGTIEGLRINRLMKWSVQVAQRMSTVVSGDGVETRTLGEEFACRLELDINTAPGFGRPLPAPDPLLMLLSELVSLGYTIAKDGDVL